MNKEISLNKQSIDLSNNNFIYICPKLQKQAKIQHFFVLNLRNKRYVPIMYIVFVLCPLDA